MKQSEPKYNVKVVKNVLIPMRDGVNLAADLHMPDVQGKFPAVLNYCPYHKDGFAGIGFAEELSEFAQSGYVHVLPDMRGIGCSEGFAPRIMSLQQWEDGYDAVEWISQQPWCDGNVGMWGVSYGGISSIHVGALSPPHLKAVIPIMGDVALSGFAYPGGVLRCLLPSMLCTMMIGMNFMPPLYTDNEGLWMKIWNYHLQHNKEWHFSLYEHPTEDDFMREGAALSRLDKIKAATYFMGGWKDLFGNSFSYNSIKSPKRVLIGPWKHGVPNVAVPGPNIDYFNEMIRWFDYWLKGIDTGIMDEPPITIWVQGANVKWRYEKEWPISRRKETTLYLHPEGVLEGKPYEGKDESDSFNHNAMVGTARGLEDPLGLPFGSPMDQRVDEALSLIYTTQPLPEDKEITGAPIITLFTSTSADAGAVVVKLNDVSPDGSSTSITYGCLNIAQRESRERILPVKPGEVYELSIKLSDTSYLVKAGHRLRLAIASSDFPFIWPTPKAAVNMVYHNQKYPSLIVIPFVPEQIPPLPTPQLREVSLPTHLPPTIEYYKPYWRIERDPVSSTVTVYTGVENKFIISPTTILEMIQHVKAVASDLDPTATYVTADVSFNIEGHKLGTVNIKVNTMTTPETGHSTINIIVNGLQTFIKRWSRP